jgi:hypothetical protein
VFVATGANSSAVLGPMPALEGRMHDSRHTLTTQLSESGADDQTIMDTAGHVSRQMLKHHSHIRMQTKRDALRRSGRARNEPRTRSTTTRNRRKIARRSPPMRRRLKESSYKSPYNRVLQGVAIIGGLFVNR